MTVRGIRLGPLAVPGQVLMRSGIRWTRSDGASCAAGEIIGYCNIGLQHGEGRGHRPFGAEARDLQVAVVAPVAGRLCLHRGVSLGGYSDLIVGVIWRGEDVVASMDVPGDAGNEPLEAVLYLMAGRRMTEIAEGRSGLMTGWHSMQRVSHIAQAPTAGTLLSMGICEIEPVLKGNGHDYAELMRDVPGPAQVVFVPDQVLVPNARVLIEQMQRTPESLAQVSAALRGFIAGDEGAPKLEAWYFIATLLRMLGADPLGATHDVLSRTGLHRSAPPNALLLSIRTELCTTLRHRETGCTFNFHGFRLREAGQVFMRWLRANCDVVPKTPERLLADYEELIGLLRARNPDMQIFMFNMTSTSGRDDMQSYANSETLTESVVAKDLNLLVSTLARQHDIGVIDVDALGAEHGLARHSLDGLHHDGAMAKAIRNELVDVLAARGVAGFCR